MGSLSRPRKGSLQYWPRKRARKILPSVNWKGISSKNDDKKLLGFVGYKVGMVSAFVRDMTPESMTKNKRITIPATVIECPPLKIFSVRFYKDKKIVSEILSEKLDKELKRKLKLPKTSSKKKLDDIKDYDDIKIVTYSTVSKTSIKKKPDVSEFAIGGSKEDKLAFVKENLGKEIKISDVFENMQLVDVRGVTKGKGMQGPVKRFGITLRQHKSEKGLRKVGSIGPWHPAHVSFRVPMAGQMGFFTRSVYNNKVIDINSINEKNINPPSGFKNFGQIKTDYLILRGSIQGPSKRQLILTQPLRKTRKQDKLNFELIELR